MGGMLVGRKEKKINLCVKSSLNQGRPFWSEQYGAAGEKRV